MSDNPRAYLSPGLAARPAVGGLAGYFGALATVAAATGLCELARPYLSPVNMVMPYLLAVVLVAVRLGRRPAVVAALFSVVDFDFFFVPPRFSFTIADKEFLITFFALFVVGVVISTLVAQLQERAEALRLRELRTASLYNLTRELAAAVDRPALTAALVKNAEATLAARVAVFLPVEERLEVAASSRDLPLGTADFDVALWCFRSRRTAGRGTESFSSSRLVFIPLKALAATLGVLAIEVADAEREPEEMNRLLDSYATQVAQALERIRLSREAQQAQIHKARESLERALLNSVSHDLRTPLATITGVLTTVLEEGERLGEGARRELLETARGEADRLNRFVGNLLDMTRLESGGVALNLEPCDVQDLVGCALAAVEKQTAGRQVDVRVPVDLPLVPMDLVLMIQVLVNLLDNAFKHSPEGCPVAIAAERAGGSLVITVSDCGPGVPEADLGRIFDKFYRIPVPEGAGGTGLGLSICKGIVEAHGGEIRARNGAAGGLEVSVSLPVREA
ncbi:DUF4118 domain-containing protein [Geomesophilobacter sediminis]|uniref:histidine kinase n=1 Tax=Geomesophilobacter sediminis TaxID=2798584 RepID=A0A8J7IXB2_9BACT|nr:DUF4118 domain-containing protein [Geomesophilobacter sediminis]MBJ6724472.1 DUF4118 domain-containing protein [Geomesophilobacter sediminis]